MARKRSLLKLTIGILLVLSLIGCQTTPKNEPIAQAAEVEKTPTAEEAVTVPIQKEMEKAAADAKEDIIIKLIETSDLHGSLFPYDFINDKETETSLAQVYSYVEEERAKDQRVVLMDNGDILQGQPIVYYYNFEKTEGMHIMPEVMNAMGYDVATVGNHDIEAGPEVYSRVYEQAEFPYVCANAVWESNGDPVIDPYTIIEYKGLKIAVIGLITPAIPNWLPSYLYPGVRFDDMVDSAKKWVPIIKTKENPDLIVGLFHSGVDYNYGGYSKEDKYNENASELVAQMVDGFDIIFTGHDHQDTNKMVESPSGKKVILLGALNAARTVATAEITFSWDEVSKAYVIANIMPETIPMNSFPVSSIAMNAFGAAKDEVKEWVSRPLGVLSDTISTKDAMFGDSKFVDLIHRLQLELTGADISFAAPLSLNAELKGGTIRVRDMFNLYVYENLLYTMELTGAEIDAFLEYSYANWFNQMKDIDDNLIKFKKDANGNFIFNERYNNYDTATRYYNWDSAAGVKYTVDVTKPEGDRVSLKSLTKDNSRIDMNKTYTVAINSYRGNGGGGHLTSGVGLTKEEIAERTKASTMMDLRYYFIKAFELLGVITPEVDNNWIVSPIVWAKRAALKDGPMLFGN